MPDPTDQPSSEVEFVNRPYSQKAVSALSMRVAGATLDEICTVVGFASTKEAITAIDKALREELRGDEKNRDKMRQIANQRLERLLRSVWSKAIDEDHPEHLNAVAKARELIDRHIKLYGLDAPAEMIVHNPDSGEIEAWVMQIMGQADNPDVVEADILDEDDDEGFGGVPALTSA
jgi:type II secretory pathway component PulK